MRSRDIRRREAKDLREEVVRIREQMFNLRFHGRSEDKGDRGAIRKHRRDIARIETILKEREMGLARSAAPEGK